LFGLIPLSSNGNCTVSDGRYDQSLIPEQAESAPQTLSTDGRQVVANLGVSERFIRDHRARRSPRIPGVILENLLRYRADIEDFMAALSQRDTDLSADASTKLSVGENMMSVREPDALAAHLRFDERDVKTGMVWIMRHRQTKRSDTDY
jgi:hypothetical protein